MSRNRWGGGAALPPVEPIDGQLALEPLAFDEAWCTCPDIGRDNWKTPHDTGCPSTLTGRAS